MVLTHFDYGLYASARKSSISGKIIPEKNLWELADEFLQKRKIASAPSRAEMAYNSGLSTQVPTGRTVGVRGRVSRKIGYDEKYISFEKVS